MMSSTVKRGDTVTMTLTVKDSAGVAINLTGATVKVLAKNTATSEVSTLSSTISDAPNGKVQHVFTGSLAEGTYNVEVEVTDDGVIATAPGDGYGTLIVKPDLG
jgi:hypothetical protein